ncbi:MAG: hypothetical protein WC797_00345 [Candidatus Paceibacterota bacterium]|jgi:hypothetical protein
MRTRATGSTKGSPVSQGSAPVQQQPAERPIEKLGADVSKTPAERPFGLSKDFRFPVGLKSGQFVLEFRANPARKTTKDGGPRFGSNSFLANGVHNVAVEEYDGSSELVRVSITVQVAQAAIGSGTSRSVARKLVFQAYRSEELRTHRVEMPGHASIRIDDMGTRIELCHDQKSMALLRVLVYGDDETAVGKAIEALTMDVAHEVAPNRNSEGFNTLLRIGLVDDVAADKAYRPPQGAVVPQGIQMEFAKGNLRGRARNIAGFYKSWAVGLTSLDADALTNLELVNTGKREPGLQNSLWLDLTKVVKS